MRLSARQLAESLDGEVHGNENVEIVGVAAASEAGEGSVTFAESPAHLAQALASRASVVLAGPDGPKRPPTGKTLILVKSPRVAFAKTLAIFHPPDSPPAGIHATASVAAGAEIGEGVHVGAFAVISGGARIGARTIIHPHAVIGADAVIGEDCVVHALSLIHI